VNLRKFPEKLVKEAKFIYEVEIIIDLWLPDNIFNFSDIIDWDYDDYHISKFHKNYYLTFERQINIDEVKNKIKASIEKEKMTRSVEIRISLSENDIEYELPTINLEEDNHGRQKRSTSNLRLREDLRSQEMCT
jgi:hypothetical protein